MAACIDPATWQQAVSDCAAAKAATASVHGLGAPNYVRAGMRGLGLSYSASASLNPGIFSSLLTGASAPAAPAAPSAPTGIKTNVPAPPAGSTLDPCGLLASGMPCSNQGTCPAGWAPYSPGPGVTDCRKIAPSLTAAPQRATATTPPPPMTATMTPQPVTTTAGFSHWGLLAALAVGGFVVYKVATHKKS
jgi:hypothetical protein